MVTAAERAQDRGHLLATLADLVKSGRPVPCLAMGVDQSASFISEDEHVQARAAVHCIPCAGVLRCQAYGRRYPDEWGVYGGETRTERRQAANARRKATAS